MKCTARDVVCVGLFFLLVLSARGDARRTSCSGVGGVGGRCVPLATCFQVYHDMEENGKMSCTLRGNGPGVCCPVSGQPRGNGRWRGEGSQVMMDILKRFVASRKNNSEVLSTVGPSLGFWSKEVSKKVIQEARLDVLKKILIRDETESELLNRGLVVEKGTPEFLHQFFLQPFPEALKQSQRALIQDESIKSILTNAETKRISSRQGTSTSANCPIRPCHRLLANSKYRPIDGSCNNVQHGDWGSAFTALSRLIRPQYADGFSKPREMAVDGRQLPSARQVSAAFVSDVNRPSPVASLIVMNWGQFINHDVTLTAVSAMNNGAGIKCCSGLQGMMNFLRHDECFHINIPKGDPFYGPIGQTCMEFVRSMPAASDRKSCEFGFRDQLNEVTSFIDGSVIYGSIESISKNLRLMEKGQLKTVQCFGNFYLPFSQRNSSACGRPFQNFLTGDVRATEQSHLSALHTIFLREHNRIASELSTINPSWNDETVFQETRRIIGAILQHVTYNEFLPIILGSRVMEAANIQPVKENHTNLYRSDVHPGILNEFAAAANRYGHSLIQGEMEMLNANDESEGTVNVRDQFVTPVPLYFPQNLDRILRGITKQPVQQVDPFMSRDLTQHLYQVSTQFGLDLASANIQRGRDHGLPSYNNYRKFCGLQKADTFEDLLKQINGKMVTRLKTIYRSVDDIDLWIGLVSERPLKGALVGPTLTCLLVEQYWRLKIGDRYWYEEKNSPGAFSLDQLKELRKVTLARLLCNNGDRIHQMQPLAFLQPTDWNPRVQCNSSAIPQINLEPWRINVRNHS